MVEFLHSRRLVTKTTLAINFHNNLVTLSHRSENLRSQACQKIVTVTGVKNSQNPLFQWPTVAFLFHISSQHLSYYNFAKAEILVFTVAAINFRISTIIHLRSKYILKSKLAWQTKACKAKKAEV